MDKLPFPAKGCVNIQHDSGGGSSTTLDIQTPGEEVFGPQKTYLKYQTSGGMTGCLGLLSTHTGLKRHRNQVIQAMTFLSPNVEGHDSPLKGSRELTIPKRSQSQNCQA